MQPLGYNVIGSTSLNASSVCWFSLHVIPKKKFLNNFPPPLDQSWGQKTWVCWLEHPDPSLGSAGSWMGVWWCSHHQACLALLAHLPPCPCSQWTCHYSSIICKSLTSQLVLTSDFSKLDRMKSHFTGSEGGRRWFSKPGGQKAGGGGVELELKERLLNADLDFWGWGFFFTEQLLNTLRNSHLPFPQNRCQSFCIVLLKGRSLSLLLFADINVILMVFTMTHVNTLILLPYILLFS